MVFKALERAVAQRVPLDVTARLQMQDGQIRFFGLFMVLLGLVVLWWVG